VSAVGELIESYGLSYHQFADDTQLLVKMDSTNATPAIDRLAHCSAAVRLWFLQNGLQLNADKSEVVLLGTPAQLRSATNITTVDVTGSTLPVASKLQPAVRLSRQKETLQRPATSTLALCATCADY